MDIYLVGGAVRDALMGLPVHDRDWVVVGSTPEAMVAQGFVPVGRDFPVFLHPTTREEYALARTERKTARGYQGFAVHAAPDVTLAQDLARRDLTINSIAAQVINTRAYRSKSLEKTDFSVLIDPYGGQNDIQAKVLRHVSDAFAEDPVRILRLARFAARFADFSVAPQTLALMQQMVASGEVDALVAERVWQELAKGLMTTAPQRMLTVLQHSGALARLLPELTQRLATAPASAAPAAAATTPAADTSAAAAPALPGWAALAYAATLHAPLTVRFACLCLDLANAAALAPLTARLRVPADCKALAGTLLRERATIDHSAALDAHALVALLARCDAIRQPARFAELLLASHCAFCADRPASDVAAGYPQRAFLLQVQAASLGVVTHTLAAKAQAAGLTGPAVGALVQAARLQAVAALIARLAGLAGAD